LRTREGCGRPKKRGDLSATAGVVLAVYSDEDLRLILERLRRSTEAGALSGKELPEWKRVLVAALVSNQQPPSRLWRLKLKRRTFCRDSCKTSENGPSGP
jgi:hypothetical protein